MARTPKYKAAEAEMRRRIAAGDWAPGLRLGNEFELAAEFGVSQGTMRRALMTLEAEGHLARKPGRGTIVAEPPAPRPAAAAAPVLRDGGGGPPAFAVHRAKLSRRRQDAEEGALFGPGEVLHLERLLKLGSTRAAIEEISVPLTRAEGLDEDAPVDFAEFLAAHDLTPARIETRAAARMTTMGESVTLSCDRNTALLVVIRVAYGAGGWAIARQVLLIADPDVSFGG